MMNMVKRKVYLTDEMRQDLTLLFTDAWVGGVKVPWSDDTLDSFERTRKRLGV